MGAPAGGQRDPVVRDGPGSKGALCTQQHLGILFPPVAVRMCACPVGPLRLLPTDSKCCLDGARTRFRLTYARMSAGRVSARRRRSTAATAPQRPAAAGAMPPNPCRLRCLKPAASACVLRVWSCTDRFLSCRRAAPLETYCSHPRRNCAKNPRRALLHCLRCRSVAWVLSPVRSLKETRRRDAGTEQLPGRLCENDVSAHRVLILLMLLCIALVHCVHTLFWNRSAGRTRIRRPHAVSTDASGSPTAGCFPQPQRPLLARLPHTQGVTDLDWLDSVAIDDGCAATGELDCRSDWPANLFAQVRPAQPGAGRVRAALRGPADASLREIGPCHAWSVPCCPDCCASLIVGRRASPHVRRPDGGTCSTTPGSGRQRARLRATARSARTQSQPPAACPTPSSAATWCLGSVGRGTGRMRGSATPDCAGSGGTR